MRRRGTSTGLVLCENNEIITRALKRYFHTDAFSIKIPINREKHSREGESETKFNSVRVSSFANRTNKRIVLSKIIIVRIISRTYYVFIVFNKNT